MQYCLHSGVGRPIRIEIKIKEKSFVDIFIHLAMHFVHPNQTAMVDVSFKKKKIKIKKMKKLMKYGGRDDRLIV